MLFSKMGPPRFLRTTPPGDRSTVHPKGNKMKRRTILISGAAASLATCFTAASAQTPSPIRLGLTLSDQGLLGVYAQEQGFFQRDGLNVDVQPFTNAGTLAQARNA